LKLQDLATASISNMLSKHSILRSAVALCSGNITAFILGTVGSLLVARFLGPAETGLYRSYTIPITYLTFLHLGTFDGLFRQIPFFVGKGVPQEAERLASAAGAWNLFLSIAVSSTFVVFALHSLWHHSAIGALAWFSQAAFCWGVFYGGYLGATYRTIHQFAMVAKIQVVQTLLNFGIVFTIPVLQFFGLCARGAIPSLAGVWIYHRNRPMRIAYRFDAKAFKAVIKVGFPFSLWGSLETSLWVATESSLVLYHGGASALGLFSMAVALREGLSVLPLAIHQVLSPRLVESFAREGSLSRRSLKKLFMVVGAITCFMVIVVLVAMIVLERLVPLCIPKYGAGVVLMKLCLWFAVVSAANIPVVTLFAAGRAWLYGIGVLIGFAVFVGCSHLMVPMFGGMVAVVVGSLLGRITRAGVAYALIPMLRRPVLSQNGIVLG
jgi:O-antigen/teichoic acid export membrane protein